MICNCLVVGRQDATVSLKLQMDPELTLKKAFIVTTQSETVKKQLSVVRPSEQSPNVDQVISKMEKLQNANSRIPRPHACIRCGKTPSHSHQECPAHEATCYKCSKREHFLESVTLLGWYVQFSIQRMIHKMIL